MEALLNTASPLMIIAIASIMSAIILISRRAEMTWPLIILMIGVTGCLIYHTVFLDGLERGSNEISEVYHCIACDLIYMLMIFMSYLWIDDIVAKKKKLKSYDDSLSWFWNKL